MSVLVSFCIFGNDPDDIYYTGAYKNAYQYHEWFPDWTLRFYIGATVPTWVTQSVTTFGAEVIRMDLPENQTSTGWRFLALRDRVWDYYLFRDVDSRPIERERDAVAEWMASGREFHTMHDHPYHNVPMLAGLWGVTLQGAARISHLIPDRLEHDEYQVDQNFLTKKIWRIARQRLMVHTSQQFGFDTFGLRRPFRIPRDRNYPFVGEGYYACDCPRHPQHREMIDVP